MTAAAREISDSVEIRFRQSKVALDTAYMDNARLLRGISERLDIYAAPGSGMVLKSVDVIGGASPEGSVAFNEWLSHRRAERIFQHLEKRLQISDSLTRFKFVGRDWQGLLDMVEADPEVPSRDAATALLKEIIANSRGGEKESAGNLRRLKQLAGGKPYAYMYDRFFPHLRASKLVMRYAEPEPAAALPVVEEKVTETLIDCIPDTVYVPVVLHDTVYIKLSPEIYIDVRTNLLLDAAAIPNIGAELYLGRQWSLGLNWWYAWWKCDHRHRYWRTYGGEVNLRRWFGSTAKRKPLAGHHAGIYATVLTYDFEWGKKGIMGGRPLGTIFDKANYGFGLEYGYSLPIARRLNLDFSIGAGYLGGEFQEYKPVDGRYEWTATKRRHWWGPTKAEISLVWLLGEGNHNGNKESKTIKYRKEEEQ